MILCNLLRVPPIFIMDELFKNSFGLPEIANMVFPVKNDLDTFKLINLNYDPTVYYKVILLCLAKIIVSFLSKYITYLFLLISNYRIVIIIIS